MVTGDPVGYTGGTTHLPIPLASDQARRTTHTPKPKATGLDFDSLVRRCSICGEKKPGRLTNGACASCAPHVATQAQPANVAVSDWGDTYVTLTDDQVNDRYSGTTRTLDDDLDELEATDPTVAAARARFDDMVDRLTHPDDHIKAPDDLGGWQIVHMSGFSMGKQWMAITPGCPTGAHPTRDCGCHVTATVDEARTYIAWQLDPPTQTPQAAAEAPSLPAEEPVPARLPHPTAATPRPAAPTERHIPRKVELAAHPTIINRYQAGDTLRDLAAAYNVTPEGIRDILRRNDVPLRPRGGNHTPADTTPGTKTCTICGATKPLEDFYKTAAGKSGRMAHCTTCNNDRPPTENRLIRNRARNRAYAALVKAHPDEYEQLFAAELTHAREEHAELQQAAAKNHDATVARLRPGPMRDGQTSTVDRLDVARCTHCHTHHDAEHECPTCGETTPETEAPDSPRLMRVWAIANDIPVPARGPLPHSVQQQYRDAHPTPSTTNTHQEHTP